MKTEPGQARETTGEGDARRRLVSRVAKAALSIVLVAVLLWKVPIGDAVDGLAALSAPGLAGIVVLAFVFPSIAAWRWKRVLARLGVGHGWGPLMGDILVSSTYNMLLPTNIGGDVVRALRCGRRVGEPHHAWSSVLFERLVGLVALALIAVPGLAMVPGDLRSLGWVVAGMIVVSVLVLLAAAAPFRAAGKLLASRLPVVAGAGERIAGDLAGPLSRPGPRLETMLWSTLYQVAGLGILMLVAWDWGQPSMVWAILGGVPLALILTLLPVSIAGLGVRESLFVVLLGQLGVDSGKAMALALVWLATALLLAFAGAAIMAIEAGAGPSHTPRTPESNA